MEISKKYLIGFFLQGRKNMKKKIYIIGNNVKKSLSPIIHNYWISKYLVNCEYKHKEIKSIKFNKHIKKILKEENLYGLNITIPFKESIITKDFIFDILSITDLKFSCKLSAFGQSKVVFFDKGVCPDFTNPE